MSEATAKVKKSVWVHTIIILFLYFGFKFLPPVLSLTQQGMAVIGIFIGLIYGLSTVNGIWPSLLAIFAVPFNGVATLPETLASGLGNDSNFLMLFMMVIAEVLAANNITKIMAYWLMSRKFMQGRPWLFSFCILYGMLLIGSLGATFGLIIIFWSIITTVCKETGMKPYDKWPTLMIFGVCLAALFTSSMWMFRGNPLFLSQAWTKIAGISINMFTYTLFNFILATISIIVFVLVCKYIFRVDVSAIQNIDVEFIRKEASSGMTSKQKFILFCFIGTIVTILSVGFLPKTWPITIALSSIGNSGCVALWMALLFVHFDGKPVLDFKVASRGIMWEVWFLSGAVLSVAGLMSAESTGIQKSLMTIVGPILTSQGTMIFTILVVVIAIVLTNFVANTVVGLLFVPIIFSCATQLGIDGTPVVCLMLVAIHLAIITPGGSPFAAMLFGNSAWVHPKDVYRYGTISIAIIAVIMLIIGIPLSNLLF
ncbi:MAG: SLC13 family permease [Peptococcaceae bacterium]|nr:SLC13 family permease [Peptococcaceae bacterium]